MRQSYIKKESLREGLHNVIINHFFTYLYVGGLPDCVKTFIEEKNVMKVKNIQKDIHTFYENDASKYDKENQLKIKRIYGMLLSCIDNKVKIINFNDIDDNKRDTYYKYQEEFDYLINSGIVLDCNAVSEPKFPFIQSTKKLVKLYMNDVGILSYI